MKKKYLIYFIFISLIILLFFGCPETGSSGGSSGGGGSGSSNSTPVIYTAGYDSSGQACYWIGTTKTTLDSSGGQALSIRVFQ